MSQALYDAYVIDIDGTVCLGDELIPTAAETISTLRSLGRRVLFVSNDASQSESTHADRLTRLGVPARPEDVLTPTPVLIRLLGEEIPVARVLVIGSPSLWESLSAAGFTHSSDPTSTDAVVVSHDRSFDYAKLAAALTAIRGGARLLATNADSNRPTPAGIEPGAGAILAAVERCSETLADAVVGKPSSYMRDAIRASAGARLDRCLIVGDQLHTDIRMAADGGMDSALVLTGVTDREQFATSADKPTYVLERLGDLLSTGRSR